MDLYCLALLSLPERSLAVRGQAAPLVSRHRIIPERAPAEMSLRLLTSPNLAPLLEHLADAIRRRPLGPRAMETIVVQSQGMRRWLTLQLADKFGCAGSLVLPFPAQFVRELGSRIAGDRTSRDERDPFSREALAWRLDALLRNLPADEATYDPLRTYLAGRDDRTRFGLATQVASRLDDYQMYRADYLLDWEQGGHAPGGSHASWQSALWRTLVEPHEESDADASMYVARRLRQTINTLQLASPPAGLPARVTVFGVSTLPPLFVELLAALARHVPVTIYSASLDPAAPHPLAVMFGSQSREFVEALRTRGAEHQSMPAGHAAREGVLATLQAELASGAAGDSVIAVASHDASVRVHNAHGGQRQLEILRDQLLAALHDDPTLRPHDILLLVPDAGEWAPLVDAVFGVSEDDTPRIPYRIADRPARRTQPAAEAMARLLALEGGRLARGEVLGFLAHPLVRRGAALSEGELDALESLIQRANVRWGYDAAARDTLGLPRYEEASWRAGLDRLLLGVAVGRTDNEVLGLLPECGDTAGEAESIAALAEWVDDLAATLAGWRMPRSLPAWSAALQAAADRFLVAEEGGEQQQLLALSSTLQRLGSLGEVTRYTGDVAFGVVRDWLEAQLDDDGFGSGFLMGGMTVAALKPMRSLPFRVIAVAGLNDGIFPRRDRRAAFDLLAHERRPGDRDLRTDDRQLFLDLLMAAGERLILTYSGRAVSDNSDQAPSVVLDELLDHLDRRSAGEARGVMVVSHPLQPFSPAYFTPGRDERLFTYSRSQGEAAQARARPRDAEPRFVASGGVPSLLEPGARLELSLRDLAECWMNPSRFYCRRVLRFSLGGDDPGVTDDEIFPLDAMAQGGIKARLLAVALAANGDRVAQSRRLMAEGALPPLALGRAWHQKLSEAVDLVMDEVPAGITPAAEPFVLDGDGWRVKGRIDGIRGTTRYVVRAGSVRPEHVVRAWVEHVVMNAARQHGVAGMPETTALIGRKNSKSVSRLDLPPVADAGGKLDRLVSAARDGYAAPLPYFPQAGWAWLNAVKPKPTTTSRRGASAPKDPKEEAAATYSEEPSMYGAGGDGVDPHIALCFRGVDPMAERWGDFERLAATLWHGWQWTDAQA